MKTPREFANAYLEGKITLPVPYPCDIHTSASYIEFEELIKKEENRKRYKLILTSDSFRHCFPEAREFPQEFNELMEKKRQAKLSAGLITNTGTDLITLIETIQRWCKVTTLNKLNLESATKAKIYTALWEFSQTMLLPYENLKKLNTIVVKKRKETINHFKKGLEYPFLDESFREKAQKEIKRLKEYDNRGTDHPIKGLDYITTLYTSHILGIKKSNKKLLEMLQTPLKLKEGRPSNFFYETLKIVVFDELRGAGKDTIEAKRLTAKIINEFIKKHGSFIAKRIIDIYIQNQVPEFAKEITKIIKQRLSKISLSRLTLKDIDNTCRKV